MKRLTVLSSYLITAEIACYDLLILSIKKIAVLEESVNKVLNLPPVSSTVNVL